MFSEPLENELDAVPNVDVLRDELSFEQELCPPRHCARLGLAADIARVDEVGEHRRRTQDMSTHRRFGLFGITCPQRGKDDTVSGVGASRLFGMMKIDPKIRLDREVQRTDLAH